MDKWNTVTKKHSEGEYSIPVTGDQPPKKLYNPVHRMFKDTIIHLCKDNQIIWRQKDNSYIFTLRDGFPQMPQMNEMGELTLLQPYRTAEKFLNNNGSRLEDRIPSKWNIEQESTHRVAFID